MSLEKARESALLAIEVYNKPAVTFRTGGFVTLMAIAWTSLFHALFFRAETKPYYRKDGSTRFVRVDGDYKHWELGECITQHYGGITCAERANLELIRQLRNKVEHRAMPEIDAAVFGECQACVLNLEELLVREFGEKYSLNSYLTFPLRISRNVPAPALRPTAEGKRVLEFVEQFRAALSTDIATDQRYCFQVYLVPRLGNHPTADTVAVEFVHYDPSRPAEMAQYEKVTALIKERQVLVVNLGHHKASEVKRLMIEMGHIDFTQNQHTRAWKHYGVRPGKGSADPAKCVAEYCVYDAVHQDYVYTDEWLRRLDAAWRNPKEREAIAATK